MGALRHNTHTLHSLIQEDKYVGGKDGIRRVPGNKPQHKLVPNHACLKSTYQMVAVIESSVGICGLQAFEHISGGAKMRQLCFQAPLATFQILQAKLRRR